MAGMAGVGMAGAGGAGMAGGAMAAGGMAGGAAASGGAAAGSASGAASATPSSGTKQLGAMMGMNDPAMAGKVNSSVQTMLKSLGPALAQNQVVRMLVAMVVLQALLNADKKHDSHSITSSLASAALLNQLKTGAVQHHGGGSHGTSNMAIHPGAAAAAYGSHAAGSTISMKA